MSKLRLSLERLKKQFLRFYFIGFITSTTCWFLYEILYYIKLSDDFHEASSWAISYTITSFLAHYLHYRITFDPNRNYWPSLWRTLLIYMTAMVFSTITDHLLIASGMHHRIAWILNMGGFGVLNFFLLRWYAYEDVFSEITPVEELPQK